MSKQVASGFVVTVLCLACTPPSGSSGQAEDVAAITQATEQWAATFARGDVEGSVQFVTRGARLVPPDQPVVSGADAIEAWVRGVLGQVTFESVVSTVDNVRVADDWAVSRGRWIMTASGDGMARTDTSRYVVIWERQADGSWKVAHDIWNFAAPTSPDE
jgi:uncharacterized protein (TIGR02246 family)